MSEALLEAIMQLFALLTDVKHATAETGRQKVAEYLSAQFNAEYVGRFLERYDYYLNRFHGSIENYEQQTSDNLSNMEAICQQINQEIDLDAKVLILNTFLNYILKAEISTEEERFVDSLANYLRIPANDYWAMKGFVLQQPLDIVDKGRLLLQTSHILISNISITRNSASTYGYSISVRQTRFYSSMTANETFTSTATRSKSAKCIQWSRDRSSTRRKSNRSITATSPKNSSRSKTMAE